MTVIGKVKLYTEDILAGKKAGNTSYKPDMTCVDRESLTELNWFDAGFRILTAANQHRKTEAAKELFVQALKKKGFSEGDLEIKDKRNNILLKLGKLLNLEPKGVERILDNLFPHSIRGKFIKPDDPAGSSVFTPERKGQMSREYDRRK